MLGKQRKNQANDPQFMDAAWKNMAEILDQEMPVEKKERRIGWLSIAAILVIGFVGGVTATWSVQKHQSSPMAINHSTELLRQTDMVNSNKNLKGGTIATNSKKEKSPTLRSNNDIDSYPKTTQDQIIVNLIDHKVHSQSTVNTENEWITPNHTIQSITHFNQNELSQTFDRQKASNLLVITENTPEKVVSAVEPISINSIEKVVRASRTLTNLPTLDMTTLSSRNTSSTIDHDLDFPKNKKWRTGAYAGAIIAGKTGNGLEATFRVERKLGAKWALETGLGLRATQLAFLSKNENVENPVDEDGFFLGSNDPSIEMSNAEQLQIVNKINANASDYHLAVPLSLVFRPMGKLQLALGMSWALRLNKLEDATLFDIDPVRSFQGPNLSDENSFSERFDDFRLNLGVGYQFNARTGIELGYSERLSNRGNIFGDPTANLDSTYDENTSPTRFFRIGWMYYFGE